jgi:hypothetical protein
MDAALELAMDGCAMVHGMMKKRLLKSLGRGGGEAMDVEGGSA